jgi:non-reducing end alpha-L-arabinofuranosidase
LQGVIILGTGGDGSNGGRGTFFEGAMISGNPPDSVDDVVQANIVAAGYGR